jgi:hypothetical protein
VVAEAILQVAPSSGPRLGLAVPGQAEQDAAHVLERLVIVEVGLLGGRRGRDLAPGLGDLRRQ